MKSLTMLWTAVAQDYGRRCCADTGKDVEYVLHRVEDEGLSFLTITLSAFGKDLERAIADGQVGSNHFLGFKRSGGLPAFLQGFLRQIFDRQSGDLLQQASTEAVQAVRQLTLMFGKIEIPCSESRNRKAFQAYVQCEMEVRDSDSRLSGRGSDVDRLRTVFTVLYGDVLSRMERPLFEGRSDFLVPRHGPGATADRLDGNQKFRQVVWHERLHRVFRAEEFLLPSYRWLDGNDCTHGFTFIQPGAEQPVRVVLVPKTLKTPRVIAIEPTCMQYAQQALMRPLVEGLKHNLPSFLDLTDQEPNKVLAQKGSIDGSLATLDLSEASDRVSNQLVIELMRQFPHVSEAIQACRSRSAEVNGETYRLAKFASMGSALTFPIESMVFLAIVFYSIGRVSPDLRSVPRALKAMRGMVRIFGDDIIVPREYALPVIEDLEAFGFKVNLNKSFWSGNFRESCGGDYFKGDDVSVVRLKKLIPSDRESVDEVQAVVSFRNLCYFRGLWGTCQLLDSMIGEFLPRFPIVEPTSSVLGRHSFLPYREERHNEHLHRPEVFGYVTDAKPDVNRLDGVHALLKFFVMRGEEPLEAGHLERSGRPRTVGIKARWTTPY